MSTPFEIIKNEFKENYKILYDFFEIEMICEGISSDDNAMAWYHAEPPSALRFKTSKARYLLKDSVVVLKRKEDKHTSILNIIISEKKASFTCKKGGVYRRI